MRQTSRRRLKSFSVIATRSNLAVQPCLGKMPVAEPCPATRSKLGLPPAKSRINRHYWKQEELSNRCLHFVNYLYPIVVLSSAFQDMERFKVCEKETKTKAFSKEGLAQALPPVMNYSV